LGQYCRKPEPGCVEWKNVEGRYKSYETVPRGGCNRDLIQLYVCHPAVIEARSLDSPANIVQVSFPAEVEGELRMGEVGILITDSALDSQMRDLYQSLYRTIRKEMTRCLKRGVWGRNSNTGREHFYKEILISEDVERAARSGLVLRTLLGDGFVRFSPDRAH
jgi:hypothetical protein